MIKKIQIVCALLLPLLSLKAQIQISAFEANQLNADNSTQQVQITGPANTNFTGVLISIENDTTPNPGVVQDVANITGTFDENGILVATIDDLENPSFSLVLLDSFTGTANSTDIDTNNDGAPDNITTFGNVLDAIGVADSNSDEALLYADDLGGSNLENIATNNEPSLVFRDSQTGTIYQVNQAGDTIFDAITEQEVPESDFNINPLPVSSFNFNAPTPFNSNSSTLGLLFNENHVTEMELYAYPNPVQTNLVIKIKNDIEIKDVTVFNTQGTVLFLGEKNNLENKIELDFSEFDNGIYLVKISSSQGIITKKIIKN